VDVAELGPHPAVDRWRQFAGEVLRQSWQDRGSRFAALRDRHQLREMAAASRASTRAAHEDPLTGLGNRRELAARMEGSYGAVSVVFVDVDRFKVVNDRFSHAVGDEVLRRVAVLLRSQCRGDDLVVRYGGDEFVILVSADEDAAEDIAARVHEAVHTAPWHEVALGLRVTVSIGVAHAPEPAAAMTAADAAMLAAKRAGRDRVVPA
jgi:diguanylate cyclase (GGDEF)-like protein